MAVDPQAVYLNRMYAELRQSNALNAEEKFFYLFQCIRISFAKGTGDRATGLSANLLYKQIYNEYKQHFVNRFSFIPKAERCEDVVFVLTGQFLGLGHAPTQTALDRCSTLIKHLHKKVVLINTR